MAKNSSQIRDSYRFRRSLEAGYELPDENSLGVFGMGVLALIAGFGIFMGCWWLFNHFKNEVSKEQVPRSVFVSGEMLPPPPRLQLNPQLDLEKMLREDHDLLSSFGWVKGREWIHIPIDEAMNLLVEENMRKGARKK